MNKQFTIKPMTIEDYDGLHALWMTIHGFGIRSIDDSREGVERFINRNPGTSVVAIGEDGAVVGGILCGHDGCMCQRRLPKTWHWQSHGRSLHECSESGTYQQGQPDRFYPE